MRILTSSLARKARPRTERDIAAVRGLFAGGRGGGDAGNQTPFSPGNDPTSVSRRYEAHSRPLTDALALVAGVFSSARVLSRPAYLDIPVAPAVR